MIQCDDYFTHCMHICAPWPYSVNCALTFKRIVCVQDKSFADKNFMDNSSPRLKCLCKQKPDNITWYVHWLTGRQRQFLSYLLTRALWICNLHRGCCCIYMISKHVCYSTPLCRMQGTGMCTHTHACMYSNICIHTCTHTLAHTHTHTPVSYTHLTLPTSVYV